MEALESLRADIARNKAAGKGLPPDVRKYFNDTVWPFLEALVEGTDEVLEDHDQTIAEIIAEEDELLHGETTAGIIDVLTLGNRLVAELVNRLPPGDPLRADATIYGEKVLEVMQRLAEITVAEDAPPEVPAAEGGDDAEEGENDDEEDGDDAEDGEP